MNKHLSGLFKSSAHQQSCSLKGSGLLSLITTQTASLESLSKRSPRLALILQARPWLSGAQSQQNLRYELTVDLIGHSRHIQFRSTKSVTMNKIVADLIGGSDPVFMSEHSLRLSSIYQPENGHYTLEARCLICDGFWIVASPSAIGASPSVKETVEGLIEELASAVSGDMCTTTLARRQAAAEWITGFLAKGCMPAIPR